MSPGNRKRPASGASSVSPASNTPIVAPPTNEWQRLASHVDGAFVVLVTTAYASYRRRVWLTLAAAERAASRARDAGHDAVVLLAELKPLSARCDSSTGDEGYR